MQDSLIKTEATLVLPKCRLTENGMALIFGEDITHNELMAVGKTLKNIEGAVQFWIGDWINHNWGRYEHGKYDEAEEEGYNKSSLEKYSNISNNVKSCTRVQELSWPHHQLVKQTLKDCAWASNSVLSTRRIPKLSFEHHKQVTEFPS